MPPRVGPRPPEHVLELLRQLGKAVRDARLRRGISTAVMAERVFVSHVTTMNVEKGHPGVQIGTYARVLFVLDLLDHLKTFAELNRAELAADEQLPRRVRAPRTFYPKK